MMMNETEAEAVIDAIKRGRQFSFSSYVAGVREVLEFDEEAGSFVHRVHHTDDPEVEKSVFTREGFKTHLEASFSYKSFDLPPVKGAGVRDSRS